jgi:hypothetical protein
MGWQPVPNRTMNRTMNTPLLGTMFCYKCGWALKVSLIDVKKIKCFRKHRAPFHSTALLHNQMQYMPAALSEGSSKRIYSLNLSQQARYVTCHDSRIIIIIN